MEAQLAHIPRRNRPTADYVDGRTELTFNDVNDLYAFLAREIALSKKKHSKFAIEAGMAHGTVSRMAHGDTHYPRFQTVFAMLKVLGYELVVRA